MYPTHIHLSRFLIAFAAVIGQFVPASAAWVCGEFGCSGSASQSCCTQVGPAEQDINLQCSLCSPQPVEGSAPPCYCHQKARHDSATKVEACRPLDLQQPDHFAVVRVYDDSAEASAELMRLVLAAGEIIPYRPPRILFGVWRN